MVNLGCHQDLESTKQRAIGHSFKELFLSTLLGVGRLAPTCVQHHQVVSYPAEGVWEKDSFCLCLLVLAVL